MASRFQRGLYKTWRVARPAVYLVACVPAVVFVEDNVVDIAYVRGISMGTSFNSPKGSITGSSSSDPISRDLVILSKWSAGTSAQRGDVISFWSPVTPDKQVVKRVLAVTNDEVETRPPHPFCREIVPPGHVWVEGDNLEGRFSRDSNAYGPISRSLITGKVVARVWPHPTWFDKKEWEDSEAVQRNRRIRRNVGREMEATIW